MEDLLVANVAAESRDPASLLRLIRDIAVHADGETIESLRQRLEKIHEVADVPAQSAPPVLVEVSERMGDAGPDGSPRYHAQIQSQPGVWSAGRNLHEAVGDLVYHHPDHFRVRVTYLGKQVR